MNSTSTFRRNWFIQFFLRKLFCYTLPGFAKYFNICFLMNVNDNTFQKGNDLKVLCLLLQNSNWDFIFGKTTVCRNTEIFI